MINESYPASDDVVEYYLLEDTQHTVNATDYV